MILGLIPLLLQLGYNGRVHSTVPQGPSPNGRRTLPRLGLDQEALVEQLLQDAAASSNAPRLPNNKGSSVSSGGDNYTTPTDDSNECNSEY